MCIRSSRRLFAPSMIDGSAALAVTVTEAARVHV